MKIKSLLITLFKIILLFASSQSTGCINFVIVFTSRFLNEIKVRKLSISSKMGKDISERWKTVIIKGQCKASEHGVMCKGRQKEVQVTRAPTKTM